MTVAGRSRSNEWSGGSGHSETVSEEPAQTGPLLRKLARPDAADGWRGCAEDTGFDQRDSSGNEKANFAGVGMPHTQNLQVAPTVKRSPLIVRPMLSVKKGSFSFSICAR